MSDSGQSVVASTVLIDESDRPHFNRGLQDEHIRAASPCGGFTYGGEGGGAKNVSTFAGGA